MASARRIACALLVAASGAADDDPCAPPPTLVAPIPPRCDDAVRRLVRPPAGKAAADVWHDFVRSTWPEERRREQPPETRPPHPPPHPSPHHHGAAEKPARRAWVLIPFGFELSMLRLHVETLASVVHRFIVVESLCDISSGAFKPPHLAHAVESGRFPRSLYSRLVHRVVDPMGADASERGVHAGEGGEGARHVRCGTRPRHATYPWKKCLEASQRCARTRVPSRSGDSARARARGPRAREP